MLKRLVITLLLTISWGVAMATEEPEYRVLEKSEDIELRAYEPRIVAEVVVSGNMDQATGQGFRLLADYIFGNNTARQGGNQKISMTTPVTMEPAAETISMTAPVTMQESGGQWRVSFVMPAKYTLETLPRPNNPAVTLRAIPVRHYAVIRFSGLTGEDKVARKTRQLMEWLSRHEIQPSGEPELARYNPPWTLPFLRRNEVLVEYHPPAGD